MVRPEIVWGVLDCPGGWALSRFNKNDPFFPALGTIAVDLRSPIAAGDTVVVLGWPLGSEGRKHHAGTAILGVDGELKAVARQPASRSSVGGRDKQRLRLGERVRRGPVIGPTGTPRCEPQIHAS